MITDYEDDTPQAAPPLSQRLNLDLALLTHEELISLISECRDLLPALSDINLEDEIVYQFISAKAMLETVRANTLIPVNQRAQLQNSVAGIIDQLAKLQKAMYGPEQNRLRERALVSALKQHPNLQSAYFAALESALAEQ